MLQFAADLRALRAGAGSVPYRELARRAHYSPGTLSDAASGRKLPSLAVTLAYVAACGGDPQQWERRWHSIAADIAGEGTAEGATSEVEGRGDVADSPYLGLAAFGVEHADRFFGREALVDRLVEKVRQQRFTVVFGASGCGKTSLLQAGLVASIRNQEDPDTGWPVVVIRPGAHPVEECAVGLAAVTGRSVTELRSDLWADGQALHLNVRQAVARGAQNRDLLLVVDQFEELFTVCRQDDERSQFIDLLVTAASSETSRVRVVLAVRADFLSHCSQDPTLVSVLGDSQVAVGPMTTDELLRAITLPARQVNSTLEGALLAALVADSAGEPGVLPLVSHALVETWRRRRGNTLTLAGYQAAGGIYHALARTAEATYGALTEDQQRRAKNLFLRLTALGDRTEDTKRPVAHSEVADDPDTRLVLQVLARARLITVDHDGVQIAHEALIRCWPRLRDWLLEDREGHRVHRHLTEATATWHALDRDQDSLLRGTRLAVAREWASTHDDALTTAEREFLAASTDAETAERHARRRLTRRQRRLAAVVLVMLVLLTGALGYGVSAERSSAQQRLTAIAERADLEAMSLKPSDPDLAAQISLAAYGAAPTARTRGSVLSYFNASRPVPLNTEPHPTAAVYRADGRLLVVGGENSVELWDTRDPQHLQRLKVLDLSVQAQSSLALSPDGHLLAAASGGLCHLWDISDPDHSHEMAVFGSLGVLSVAFNPTGHTMATGSDDHRIRLWDITEPSHARSVTELTGHAGGVDYLAFDSSGHLLISHSWDKDARLWDLTDRGHPDERGSFGSAGHVLSAIMALDGSKAVTLTDQPPSVQTLWTIPTSGAPVAAGAFGTQGGEPTVTTFSPDGQILATANRDHTVGLRDVTSRADQSSLLYSLPSQPTSPAALTFSPDGNTLLVMGSEGVQLNDLPELAIRGNTRGLTAMALSADGHALATTDTSGLLRLWDTTRPDDPHLKSTDIIVRSWIIPSQRDISAMAFSPDGRTLAAGDNGGAILLWDIHQLDNPHQIGHAVVERTSFSLISFSPDGHFVASVTKDHAIVDLWDITHPDVVQHVAELVGSTTPVRTVAYSPDGHTIATGNDDGTVRLWDVTTPQQAHEITSLKVGQPVTALAISPSGETLATSGTDVPLQLWDIADRTTPRPLGIVNESTDAILTAAFRPDNTLVAIGGHHTASLWDVSDPAHPANLATIDELDDNLVHVVAGQNGTTFATLTSDTLSLWTTDPRQAAEHICSTTRHKITAADWKTYLSDLDYQPPCN